MNKPESKSSNHAFLVAAGILLSRVAGLIRERAFAHFFGNTWQGDAFKAALKIPNFLQNLFGEGALSASFIPVYTQLKMQDPDKAKDLAYSVFSFLFLLTSVFILVGVVFADQLIDLIAPGFSGESQLLTIQLVRIFFPGTGLLVLSAWCLGVLNSHRKFFLSYSAPVIWNFSIIVALIYFGHSGMSLESLSVYVAWGLVIGSALQFLVQVPSVLKILGAVKEVRASSESKVVFANFLPAVTSRGVVQISAYIDNIMASYLPVGTVSALAYSQTLSLLPISLFGMSIAASELPNLSELANSNAKANAEDLKKIETKLTDSFARIAFFIIPTMAVFLFLGKFVISLLFQSGNFTASDSARVGWILIGSTFGLLSSTWGRLISSTFYAFRDTRTPFKFSCVRVALTISLGYVFAFPLLKFFGMDATWGGAGLTMAAGLAGWIEFLMLKSAIQRKGLKIELGFVNQLKLWAASLTAVLVAYLVSEFNHVNVVWLNSLLVLSVFSVVFGLLAIAFGNKQALQLKNKILSRF